MKKLILLVLIFLGGFSIVSPIGSAQSLTSPVKHIFETDLEKNKLFEDTSLKDYTGLPDNVSDELRWSSETGGQYQLRRVVEIFVKFLQKFLAPIGIILLLVAGMQLVASRGNEEAIATKKKQIRLMAAGYAGIILSVTMVDFLFFGQEGEILRVDDATGEINTGKFAAGFWDQMQGIFDYVSTFFIAFGILMLIASMVQLIVMGGSEETMKRVKKRIMMSGIGVLVMVAIDQLVNIFSSEGEYIVIEDGKEVAVRQLGVPSFDKIIEFVGGWTNFILSFIAVIAVLAIIWAGIRLVTNFGDEEAMAQTKKIFAGIMIGLVLLFAAYAIVATLLGGAIF